MDVFFILFSKIIYLYFLIFIGYIAGKKFKVKKEILAPILIYVIAPIVFFNSIVKTKIIPEFLLLPVIFFIICTSIAFLFYFIGKYFFKDSTRNLLALSSGTGNTGYFGIPIAFGLFGKDILGIMVLGILGFGIFESSIGFYLIAIGKHSTKEALIRVLKLPTLYAIALGLFVNALHLPINDFYHLCSKSLVQIYTVIGMMIIGLGLADMKSFELDKKFISILYLAKFVVWPLIVVGLIFIDKTLIHLFTSEVYKVMFLLSIVPLAANTVAFATEFNAKPDKASFSVFLSTLIALIYIPFMIAFIYPLLNL